jgi:putative Mg2+ transporter-C (MgtC) family protein
MNSYLIAYSWLAQLYFVLQILAAFLLGGSIGWERERVGKEAGIRTFGLICMGSCIFSIVSRALFFSDPSRIAANIVVGIGFIGGGIIFHQRERSRGLTTASSLWVAAALGVCVGFNLYILAVAISLLTVVSLHLPATKFWKKLSKKALMNKI